MLSISIKPEYQQRRNSNSNNNNNNNGTMFVDTDDTTYLDRLEELDDILDEAEGILEGHAEYVSQSMNNRNNCISFDQEDVEEADSLFLSVDHQEQQQQQMMTMPSSTYTASSSSSSYLPEDIIMEPTPIRYDTSQVVTTYHRQPWNPNDETVDDFLQVFSSTAAASTAASASSFNQMMSNNFWSLGEEEQEEDNEDEDDINNTIKPWSFECLSRLTSMKKKKKKKEPSSGASSAVVANAAIRRVSSSSIECNQHKVEQWTERFHELLQFKQHHGHCLVPHNWKQNKKLSQWVKRQRYQHRLLQQGRHSTLTHERVVQLEEIGFAWNSHKAGWEERYQQLVDYHDVHGHCKVPCNWTENPSLGIWVKFQRRQYKLRCNGENNTLTDDRVRRLHNLGFVFDPCNTIQ